MLIVFARVCRRAASGGWRVEGEEAEAMDIEPPSQSAAEGTGAGGAGEKWVDSSVTKERAIGSGAGHQPYVPGGAACKSDPIRYYTVASWFRFSNQVLAPHGGLHSRPLASAAVYRLLCHAPWHRRCVG